MPSAPWMMWAVSGGCLSSEAQIALSAVWEPTIETNQRPSVASSRAKAVAESKVGRRRVTPCYRGTFPSAPFRTGRAVFTASGSPVSSKR